MRVVGKGTETYLYLNGIKPRIDVHLDDGLFFRTSFCNPTPEDIVSKCKSEIDVGISCIFLRSVSSCFHIVAKTSQQLAVKTWNSQWDAILLGALYNCEVGYNFQSDVKPEDFSKAKDFHVPNYAFKGMNSGVIKEMSVSEHKWLTINYGKAKMLMNNDRYLNAVHSLSSYRWHSMPRAQLALIWSGIEGMLGVDYELSFRLSLYIARYLSPHRKDGQKKIFNDLKELYSIRSKAVHGGKIKDPEESVNESVRILRRLVMKSAENKELPRIDKLAP